MCRTSLLGFLVVIAMAWPLNRRTAEAASCAEPVFTDPAHVYLAGDAVLIVTHPSTQWDGRLACKPGMDAAVQYAKKHGHQVVYLQDSMVQDTNPTYFFADCDPTYWVSSEGGEFSFRIPVRHVYTVGGHWEACESETMSCLMSAWSAKTEDLTITFVMDGIYTAGWFTMPEAIQKRLKGFLNVVTYRNPRDEWMIGKLSLLELMGIAKDRRTQIQILRQVLPPYAELSRDYQVDLYLEGKKVATLQQGRGDHPPVLKIEYIDSLYEGGYIPAMD